MPVEIGQLVVNARVVDSSEIQSNNTPASDGCTNNEAEQVVERYSDELLRSLDDQQER